MCTVVNSEWESIRRILLDNRRRVQRVLSTNGIFYEFIPNRDSLDILPECTVKLSTELVCCIHRPTVNKLRFGRLHCLFESWCDQVLASSDSFLLLTELLYNQYYANGRLAYKLILLRFFIVDKFYGIS